VTVDPRVDRARRGDRAATEELLAEHYDQVALICRRMTGHRDDAEDATQEALIAIVTGLPRFDGRSAFSTWVHRVAVNACLDELRRRSRRLRLIDVSVPDHRLRAEPVASQPDPGQVVGDRLDLDRALAELPLEFRAPVILRDLLGYDYSEIGAILAVPPGTVRSRIARGRTRLVALLGPTHQSTPGNQDDPADVELPGHHHPPEN